MIVDKKPSLKATSDLSLSAIKKISFLGILAVLINKNIFLYL
jgi:hypothetical protein